MAGQFWSAGAVGTLLRWTLLFAREPESDLEVEIEDSGSTSKRSASSGAPAPRKPPRFRSFILILLLLVVAGGAYVAMDPEMVMKFIEQEPADSPPSTPPLTVNRPIATPRPSPPPRAADGEGDTIAPPGAIPTPLFGEGQRVSVIPNPASPMGPVVLSLDAAGTKPGPIIGPAGTLSVLDAELHDNTWSYLVRTDDGAKGWIAEKQLAAKP